ncbi:MAG: flagellar M-ring protein FliF [Deltaproteobacteria bacterium]|nr:flagellar M-ring protein FliF [Deltaproteobacteria bacterium]
MNSINQFPEFLRALPLSKKISIAFVVVMMVSGFAFMFIWANQVDYQVLFNNLSPDDAGAIVAKLREKKIPYKIETNGAAILVPAEKVYDLRLVLAGDGLPSGGNVGFEIFDQTDFRTTKFVQELNYRRALQGELSRTINRFKEVNASRVFIVLPRESLFVEESRPASASIQLDLSTDLPPAKLAAIVHLVASAVEGLDPEQVTVVDTKGRILFKGGMRDESSALLRSAQLNYKAKVEEEIRKDVQSMLEGIVGEGRAIVRVNAEIDFTKITLNEEEYDPTATVIRSQRNITESEETGTGVEDTAQSLINQRRGVVPARGEGKNRKTKRDITTNYEINKITRTILKPAGSIKRLSVAAVIDGAYVTEKMEDGTVRKRYVPRSEEELQKFEDMVKRAMGYDEDREDQVSVSSMPFNNPLTEVMEPYRGERSFDILEVLKDHQRAIINLLLVMLVFLLVVRPLIKGLRNMGGEAVLQNKELPQGPEQYVQISEPEGKDRKEKILEITRQNPEKTTQLLKGWIGEQE